MGRQHKAPSMWLLLSWFECLELSRFQRSTCVGSDTACFTKNGPYRLMYFNVLFQLVELLGND